MKLGQASAVSGLVTDTHKVSVAGVYSIYTRTTDVSPSGIVVVISQTGSTSSSVTSSTTSPVQKHIELNGKFNCAVGDVLSVALSSNAAVDKPPNLIKTIINLRQGL